jgi:hypothetical protein
MDIVRELFIRGSRLILNPELPTELPEELAAPAAGAGGEGNDLRRMLGHIYDYCFDDIILHRQVHLCNIHEMLDNNFDLNQQINDNGDTILLYLMLVYIHRPEIRIIIYIGNFVSNSSYHISLIINLFSKYKLNTDMRNNQGENITTYLNIFKSQPRINKIVGETATRRFGSKSKLDLLGWRSSVNAEKRRTGKFIERTLGRGRKTKKSKPKRKTRKQTKKTKRKTGRKAKTTKKR